MPAGATATFVLGFWHSGMPTLHRAPGRYPRHARRILVAPLPPSGRKKEGRQPDPGGQVRQLYRAFEPRILHPAICPAPTRDLVDGAVRRNEQGASE
jgi:hypothetical protein